MTQSRPPRTQWDAHTEAGAGAKHGSKRIETLTQMSVHTGADAGARYGKHNQTGKTKCVSTRGRTPAWGTAKNNMQTTPNDQVIAHTEADAGAKHGNV